MTNTTDGGAAATHPWIAGTDTTEDLLAQMQAWFTWKHERRNSAW